jgi:hypothetical protein
MFESQDSGNFLYFMALNYSIDNMVYVIRNTIGFLLIGLSLGWMVGLSVSPVLQVLISSIITLIASVVTVIVGLKRSESNSSSTNLEKLVNRRINVIPMAIFLLSLAIGTTISIYNRTNDKFGLHPNNLVDKWFEDSLSRQRLKEELFRKAYLDGINDNKQRQFTAGLFRVDTDECGMLISKSGEELRASLLQISNGRFDSVIKSCNSERCLEELRNMICDEK